MRSRLLTAFALATVAILVVLYAPPGVTAAVLGVLMLLGGWEWSAFLSTGVGGRLGYVLLLAVLAVLGMRLTGERAHFLVLMQIAVAWWIIALLWIVLAPMQASRVAAALAGVLALVPTWLALVRIEERWNHGAEWTLLILTIAFAADTGAFFAGRSFGRRHLAPQVSPNKTWEGVGGGLLLALLVVTGANLWFAVPWGSFLPLCLAAAALSVVGDLTESLLKRHVHLKDSGRLFPGHGGVLDRIDSVTAAVPVMALGLICIGAGR
jgi:phosphatidate cytidylyltransferase